MGLDQTLSANKLYYKFFDGSGDADRIEKLKQATDLPLTHCVEVRFTVGDWRKANAIHKWFVDNVQDGSDYCGEYYVSVRALEGLKHTCNMVLKDISKAEKLLPTESGFFFGSQEYGDMYIQDLKDTIEIIDEALKLHKEMHGEISFYYSSSW